MQNKVVEVRGLSFTYPGGVEALRDVNLDVYEGEAVVVLGENGAGKTTLCYILSGIIPNVYYGLRKGEVKVFDMDPAKHKVYELSRYVSIVLQDPDVQIVTPEVRMEVEFGPLNLGFGKEEAIEVRKWALRAVGLEGLEERSPDELSGGQKQRLVIAASLAMKPRLLILDEPTSQLDPVGSKEVISVLRDLKKNGVTLIITTHKVEEIADLADRVVVLNKGRIVEEGEPSEVLSKVDLLEKVGVRPPEVTVFYSTIREAIGRDLLPRVPITIEDAVGCFKSIAKFVRVKGRGGEVAEGTKEPILEVEDLTYVYPGGVLALDNVNLRINRGEFVGIIGQNGSGKTTLVKNIVGLLRPTKGRILFKGEDISKFTVGKLAQKIGLILQNPDYQLFTISAEKEVEFGLLNIGAPRDKIKELVTEALRLVGLEDKRDVFPFRLSFGERRLLAAAAVIAMKPEVLIFDEPTTAQDYRGRYLLADIAKRMNEKGHTIIMISHDMDLIAKYARRVIVMANGRVLLDGPTKYVFSRPDVLSKAGVEPPQITRFCQRLADYGLPRDALTVEELLKAIEVAADGV